MLPPPSNKLIAHVDMNSFFASVEQQADPRLRGRPLGVCSYLHEYGCVIAASIEAKRVGMKVGMTVSQARQVCPNAVFVENEPAKYRAVSSRVFNLLSELTDRVEIYSIDEAFLDLTGWYRDAAEAVWALTRIRQRITEEVGDWLRCSIGIAPTRFLAKTASDIEKPNGLVIIDHENLDDVLARLDLEDVCGIGPRIRRRLERLGIKNLLELKRYPVANLMRVFGKYGLYLWCRLHAMEFERIHEDQPPKSIGHSYCVPARVTQEGKVEAVLAKLTERAGRRLRREGFLTAMVSVSVGFRTGVSTGPKGPFWSPVADGHSGAFKYVHLDEPAQDSFTLVGAACGLLREAWHGQSVDFLAVTLSDFSRPTSQLRLPGELRLSEVSHRDPKRWRERRVSDAVDLVRDRYGDEAIVLGSMFNLNGEAPDRIGFRKVERIEI